MNQPLQLEDEKRNQNLIGLTLIAYLILLLWVIVFKCNNINVLHIERNHSRTLWERLSKNLIPFRSIVHYVTIGHEKEILYFFVNFFLFVPMGILLPFYRTPQKSVLLILATTVSVEIFQLFSCWGGFDSTDIIMNFLGGIAGIWVYQKWIIHLPDKVINPLAAGTAFLGCTLSVFALVQTALHFPALHL
ncbi:MAG: VanZ family protein [Clostridia bacterium]|nr:VanZ family protein [Clostridia bacterium]